MKAALIFSLLLVFSLQALAWTFEDYVGVTQWRVDVTENDTDCGAEAPTTASYAIAIQHNQIAADVGSWGHGKVQGSFTGNTLSMPGRTIPDGAGTSKLSGFDVTFASDCSSFYGSYSWVYSDSTGGCSGSTTLRGTNVDKTGCPAGQGQKSKTIAEIRAERDDARKERLYWDVLAQDPKNFWANWDMAELKKKQGKYGEFFKYFDNAAGNENIFQDTREKLKAAAAERLRLSEYPTAHTVPLLGVLKNELDNWQGGLVFNVDVPKEEAVSKWWNIKYWTSLAPNASDIVYMIATP